MEVDVGYAANRFAWQARGVVVIDVARRRVENIEHVEGDPDIASHFVAAIDVNGPPVKECQGISIAVTKPSKRSMTRLAAGASLAPGKMALFGKKFWCNKP